MDDVNWVELSIFIFLFAVVSGLGFIASRWRRAKTLDHLDEWGLGGRNFGSWISWFLIGGDLYMHPGGMIDGRAIALGGCVYTSSLATIGGATECLRDVEFDVRRATTVFEISYVPVRL